MNESKPKPTLQKRTFRSLFSMGNAILSIISVGIIVATLFTLWTPTNLFSGQILDNMLTSLQNGSDGEDEIIATSTPSSKPRIGIVAGHKGKENDPGSTCSDGLTELSVNEKIATLVRQKLIQAGFEVDLLSEFDTKLTGYKALALVSIHNDSCDYVNDEATGFKVAAAQGTAYPEKADRLTACLINRYAAATGLKSHPNTITRDMTEYHNFKEINPNTTAAIIEAGFLNLDREILTKNTDKVAIGITAGILCYIRNEPIN